MDPETSVGIAVNYRATIYPMTSKHLLLAGMVGLSAATANAAVLLVQTSDPGYYNNSLGTVLNLSNTGLDNAGEPFPVNNDSNVTYPSAPNLSAASTILGNWLTAPNALNGNWSGPISIPSAWAVGTEVAVIYKFDTLDAQNVVAKFGVDNGIFAWLDGNYIFGARAGGVAVQWEYVLPLGNFAAGTHYLQLLLEDHGGSNGYAVEITADSYTPIPTPEGGATAAFWGIAVSSLFLARRKQG